MILTLLNKMQRMGETICYLSINDWNRRIFVALVLLGVYLFASASHTLAQGGSISTLTLEPDRMPSVNENSRNIVLGDLDLDGDLDAVIGIESSRDRILLNNNGTFSGNDSSRILDPNIFAHIGDLALADIDSDGDLDLVVGAYTDSDATPGVNRVYKNMSIEDDGSFRFELFYELPTDGARPLIPALPPVDDSGAERGDRTKAVAWADFDVDGDVDLAVGNEDVPNRLYINDGTGVLVMDETWAPEPANSETLAWGDVDSDRDPDLLVGNRGPSDQLYYNRNGTLVLSSWSPPPGDTRAILWADINSDGLLDIIVGQEKGPDMIFLNRNEEFGNVPDYSLSSDLPTNSIDLGDMDNDGDLDIAVGIRSESQPNLLFVNRTEKGSFELIFEQVLLEGGSEITRDLTWADIDNDGNLDLLVANQAGPDQLLLNIRSLLQRDLSQKWASRPGVTQALAWGDADNDGDPDLAVANLGGSIELYRNAENSLQPDLQWSSNADQSVVALAWGDLNSDGLLDLAVANSEPTEPNRIYLGSNNGSFSPFAWAPNAASTRDLAWGDADNDGDLDLLVANHGSPSQYYRNQNGNLVLASWQPEISTGTAIAWVDVDGGNGLDIALASDQSDRLKIYLNDGSGGFDDEHQYGSSSKDDTAAMAWGDYDGDGDPDLVLANASGADRYYINESVFGENPNLSEKTLPNSDGVSQDATWIDIDNDQDLELLVVRSDSSQIYFFNSKEAPEYQTLVDAPSDTSRIAWADYDLDGDPDVALARSTAPNQLLENLYINRNSSSIGLKVELNDVNVAAPGTPSTIPLSYTLFSPIGLPLASVRAEYLDENGQWQAAVPDLDTMTANLATASYQTVAVVGGDNSGELDPPDPSLGRQLFLPLVTTSARTRTIAGSVQHIYNWDLETTGFAGNRDDVILQLVLRPGCLNSCQRATLSVQTQPLNLRGNSIRVVRQLPNGAVEPASGAFIYRASEQSSRFEAIKRNNGELFQTDKNGYLTGNPVLLRGDRLVALAPVTVTNALPGFVTITDTLDYVEEYWVSDSPVQNGLAGHVVEVFGQQTLTVTDANPLVLFNLTLSVEWDARFDPAYMPGGTLEQDLERASAILYDATDGQAAIGDVHVFYDKGHWGQTNIAIHASNTLRPSAVLGGYVLTRTTEIVNGTEVEYIPGQVRMPPTWNKFGDPEQGRSGDDWAQVFAHELGHYLFGIPDNYLGFRNGNILSLVDCQGSLMTDPFSPEYSEFLGDVGWNNSPDCGLTVANTRLGRNDWDSIRRWYPSLRADRMNSGPSSLPLSVTSVRYFEPEHQSTALSEIEFFLNDGNGNPYSVPSGYGHAYLLRTDPDRSRDQAADYVTLLDLGRPVKNRISARGASPSDRLCVSDSSSGEFWHGCRTIEGSTQTIAVRPYADWAPSLQITSISSRTVAITVSGVMSRSLEAQIIPAVGFPSIPIPLEPHSEKLIGTLSTLDPAFYGHIRLCSPRCPTNHVGLDAAELEAVFEFTNIESWQAQGYGWGAQGYGWGAQGYGWGAQGYGWGAQGYGWGAQGYGWGAQGYGWGAPVLSSDGQVSVFPPEEVFSIGSDYYLQRIDYLPNIPSWLSSIGQAYRFDAETMPVDATILFQYLGTDVPPKAEGSLAIYYLPNSGQTWTKLTTEQNATWNLASAVMPGIGTYMLAATQSVLPPFQPTCNPAMGYSMVTTRPVPEALASIDGAYSSVYTYDASLAEDQNGMLGWRLYDSTVEEPFDELVNTLPTMELNGAYYIYITATIPVTLNLPFDLEGADLVEPADARGGLATPATYYGWVVPTAGFAPAVGTVVTATIDGTELGRTQVELIDNRLAYTIQVLPKSVLDCGVTSNEIVFSIGGQTMANNRVWDNSQAHFHILETPSR